MVAAAGKVGVEEAKPTYSTARTFFFLPRGYYMLTLFDAQSAVRKKTHKQQDIVFFLADV